MSEQSERDELTTKMMEVHARSEELRAEIETMGQNMLASLQRSKPSSPTVPPQPAGTAPDGFNDDHKLAPDPDGIPGFIYSIAAATILTIAALCIGVGRVVRKMFGGGK